MNHENRPGLFCAAEIVAAHAVWMRSWQAASVGLEKPLDAIKEMEQMAERLRDEASR